MKILFFGANLAIILKSFERIILGMLVNQSKTT